MGRRQAAYRWVVVAGTLARHHDDHRRYRPLPLRTFAVSAGDLCITLGLGLVQAHSFNGQGFFAVLLTFNLALQPFIDSLRFLFGF